MPVELRNAQRWVSVDRERFKQTAEGLLKALHQEEKSLSILLTNDRRMARIHERWMGEEIPTDVLSFPQMSVGFSGRGPRSRGGPPKRKNPQVLGDVVLSVETIARRSGPRMFEDLTRCLIHGMLHLVGYDHRDQRDRQRMGRQARYLKKVTHAC